MHSLKWRNSPREKKAAQIGLTTQDRRNQVEKKKGKVLLTDIKEKKKKTGSTLTEMRQVIKDWLPITNGSWKELTK